MNFRILTNQEIKDRVLSKIEESNRDKFEKYYDSELSSENVVDEIYTQLLLSDLLLFTQHYFELKNGSKFNTNKVATHVTKQLMRVHRGELKNLIINIPPRCGKTEITKHFAAWGFAHNKNCKYIYTSFSNELALKCSDEVKDIIKHSDFVRRFNFPKLKKSADSKTLWLLENCSGGFLGASSGSGITGFGCGGKTDKFEGALLIDDMHKPIDIEGVNLEKAIKLFTGTLLSRRNGKDKTPVIIIMQRLHSNDLIGHIDRNMPGKFTKLIIPALNNDGEVVIDDEFTKQQLIDIKNQLGSQDFSAQYLQKPTTDDGQYFKREHVKIERLPNSYGMPNVIRAWDFAYTDSKDSKNADWTVGVKLRYDKFNHKYYVEDVIRVRKRIGDVFNIITQTAKMDGIRCKIVLPKDPAAGSTNVHILSQMLDGYKLEIESQTVGLKSKEVRAFGISSQHTLGNVIINDSVWTSDFIEELVAFPTGRHDDQVDALTSAYNSFVAKGKGRGEILY